MWKCGKKLGFLETIRLEGGCRVEFPVSLLGSIRSRQDTVDAFSSEHPTVEKKLRESLSSLVKGLGECWPQRPKCLFSTVHPTQANTQEKLLPFCHDFKMVD